MAKLIDTIIDGSLQVEHDALVSGDLNIVGNLNIGEYFSTKGIRYSYLELGVQTSNITIDCNLNGIISFTLGADISINLNVDIIEGTSKEILLIIKNETAYELTWPDNIIWVKDVPPVLSTDGTDIISLILLGDNLNWLGSLQTSGNIFVDGGIWN